MQIRQLSKHLRSQEMMVFLTRAPVTTENVTEIYFGESISLFAKASRQLIRLQMPHVVVQ